jgi:hypothetical protein
VQEPVLIYAPKLSNRLDYIVKFIFKHVYKAPFVFTQSLHTVNNYTGKFINYSTTAFDNGIQIIPHTLLYENNIAEQNIVIEDYKSWPIFFATNGSGFKWDIFAAAFYLITRYEEYNYKDVDEYGRYPHHASLAYKNNFLQWPLVDIWCYLLASNIGKQVGLHYVPEYKNTITYDVDMCYSYKHKPWWKNIGGACRDLMQGKIKQVLERGLVLIGNKQDPFDMHNTILDLHKKYNKEYLFFYLVSNNNKIYDKAQPKALPEQLKSFGNKNNIGLHPSYNSMMEDRLLPDEKLYLEKIIDYTINKSRQHYIRFAIPITLQKILNAGIEHEYSMGYGSINGFRAGTAHSHYFFDLSINKPTYLLLHPFCWMDANSLYEQGYTTEQAYEELFHYKKAIQQFGGNCISIWHNFIIGHNNKNSWQQLWKNFVVEP